MESFISAWYSKYVSVGSVKNSKFIRVVVKVAIDLLNNQTKPIMLNDKTRFDCL